MRAFSWLLGLAGSVALIVFIAYASFVETEVITPPWMVVGGLGVAGIIGWLVLDWESISRSAAARGSRYSWSALALVVMGFGIAVAGNVLGKRYSKQLDATTTQIHSLSDQTVQLVQKLDREITVLAFFSTGSPEEKGFRELVSRYEERSTLLKVTYVDPEREPMLAEQNEVSSTFGTVVLKSGDKKQRLESSFDEVALTNALVRLSSDKEHKLCFTEGHEEIGADDDNTQNGLGAVVSRLEDTNYTVGSVNLAREGRVPEGCSTLITADPQVEFLPAEREMVAAWVAGGGSWLLMIDPLHSPALAADMLRYGLAIGNDVVVETSPTNQMAGMDPTFVLLGGPAFDAHPITNPLRKGMVTLRAVRTVGKTAEPPMGINVQELAFSSEAAWGETSLDRLPDVNPDVGQDRIGRVPVMAVAEVMDPANLHVGVTVLDAGGGGLSSLKPAAAPADPSAAPADPSAAPADPSAAPADPSVAPADPSAPPADPAAAPATPAAPSVQRKAGGRVVVIGDSDFAGNELVGQVNNQDLMLNALAWLVGEEDQVSIRPNKAGKGSFTMDLVQTLLVWSLLLVIGPGVVVAAAIATWRRRRSL